MIFTSPSKLTSTFCGEMSRWMRLISRPSASSWRCAYASPERISRTMNSAMSSGMRFFFSWQNRSTRRRSKPSTNSVAMYSSSLNFPRS